MASGLTISKAAARRLAALLDSLMQIRSICYNSQAFRCTETVMACIRISEEALGFVTAPAKPKMKKGRK